MSQPAADAVDDDERVPDVLRASTHDLRHFAALLRGVGFTNRATMTVTANGFTVAVEEARTLLGTAYIFGHVFDEYTYTPTVDADTDEAPSTTFELPLTALVDCLNIFGTAGAGAMSSASLKRGKAEEADVRDQSRLPQFFGGDKGTTGLRMGYAGAGWPLTLSIAEDAAGPMATCEITTYDPEPTFELPYENDHTVLRVILKSSWLRDAISEMDPATEKLTFISSPPDNAGAADERVPLRRKRAGAASVLRLRAKGPYGTSEMDYPDDRDVLETFECDAPVSFSYRYSLMLRMLKALTSSTKMSLRLDDEGLLSLQFLMPSPRARGALGPQANAAEAFVEFRCLPLDEDV